MRSALFTFAFPLVGVGLVFVPGVTVILTGVVVMVWQYFRRPAFFGGETLAMGHAGSRGRTPMR